MESTRTKVEVMKPVLLKAWIPLALSVAGFIFVRLSTRKSSFSKPISSENQVNSLTNDSREEDIEEEQQQILASTTHFDFDTKEENSELKHRIGELQDRVLKLETSFLQYCYMKDREHVLMGFENNLLLELARVEFLGREICSLEAENWRFEDLVMEYMKVFEQLGFARLENGLLHKKVEELTRKIKELFRIVWEQNKQIEAREAEGLRNQKELVTKASVVQALEGEIGELHSVIDQLKEEKKVLFHKLELVENSASSKIEAQGKAIEDYNKLASELKQLQNERAGEGKEVIFLRWSNACLRHELRRRNQNEQEETEEIRKTNQLELESRGSGEIGNFDSEKGLDCWAVTACTAHADSKMPKLIRKIRRWVKGSEKMKEKVDEGERSEKSLQR